MKLTACSECRHFLNAGELTYDKLCKASPKPAFDPIKGRAYTNGYRTVYEVNVLGACLLFEASIP